MGFTILIFFGPLIFVLMLVELAAILLDQVLGIVVMAALALNGIFLLALLILRAKWKATGRMEKNFIDSYTGWRHYGLLGVKLLFTWGAVWEALVTVGCALLLLFHPWSAVLH